MILTKSFHMTDVTDGRLLKVDGLDVEVLANVWIIERDGMRFVDSMEVVDVNVVSESGFFIAARVAAAGFKSLVEAAVEDMALRIAHNIPEKSWSIVENEE